MFIPDNKYIEIINYLPITCIDFFIINNNNLLLGKRANNPLKGVWFVPGGRILKEETQEQAIKRKLKEETGITLDIKMDIKLLGVYDTIFEGNSFDENQVTHTINITYVIDISSCNVIIKKDNQNEELNWFDINFYYLNLHQYIQNLIDNYKLRGIK